jgi:hypothetical protein
LSFALRLDIYIVSFACDQCHIHGKTRSDSSGLGCNRCRAHHALSASPPQRLLPVQIVETFYVRKRHKIQLLIFIAKFFPLAQATASELLAVSLQGCQKNA